MPTLDLGQSNETNTLWDRLVANNDPLYAGWHLTKNEIRGDFVEDIPMVDAFAYDLESNITEIRRCLITGTFEPKPPIRIEVPKGTLGLRPGSLISLSDRVVLYAILRLVAKRLDVLLPEGVWSYRVKKEDDKNSLFEETDIIDPPFLKFAFLKHATIAKKIDPLESWYDLWPRFDEQSTAVIGEYPYLSESDISAYFENISLQILRDLLARNLDDEPKIVNTIMQCFEGWAVKTEHGFRPSRGIPQGSNTSGFFGNFFLLPLDQSFRDFAKSHDIKYFRYMDDVRIFSKDYETARKVIFHMDRVIRSLHLNVQSAKTKILKGSEIRDELIDERTHKLKALQTEIIESARLKSREDARKALVRIRDGLERIRKENAKNKKAQKLSGSKKPLKGLSLRAYRMWVGCKMSVGDSRYMRSLFRELQRNPDHRLTRTFVSSFKAFPRRSAFVKQVFDFIDSDLNIYAHQEAELIRAIRYASRIEPNKKAEMIRLIVDPNKYFYVRVEYCHLITRYELTKPQLDKVATAFETETNEMVLTALALPLGQLRGEKNSEMVRKLVHHPNARVALLGKHVRHIKNDLPYARRFLNFVFEKNSDMTVCDHLGLLSYVSQSRNAKILHLLARKLKVHATDHLVIGIRPKLSSLLQQCERNLEQLRSSA